MYCTARSRFSGRRTGKTKFWSDFFSSGIINLSFDGLTYNTHRHFAHCSIFPRPFGARKNTTQLAKYPRVLYVKPSNKVYILFSKRLYAIGSNNPLVAFCTLTLCLIGKWKWIGLVLMCLLPVSLRNLYSLHASRCIVNSSQSTDSE